jgi:hypothetical protein
VDPDPDADPDTKAPTRGEEDRYAAVATAPTPDREGRPDAASTAAGAVGRRHKHKPQSYIDREISI